MKRHVPNVISVFRGLLVIPIAAYTLSAGDQVSLMAVSLLVVAWASDGIDGWIARRLHAESELGRILDPVADKVVVVGTVAVLWISHGAPTWLAVAVIARDVAMVALGISFWRRVGRVPQSDVIGKGTLSVLMLTLFAYLLNGGAVATALSWIALVAIVASSWSYGRRYLREVTLRGKLRRNKSGAPIAQSG